MDMPAYLSREHPPCLLHPICVLDNYVLLLMFRSHQTRCQNQLTQTSCFTKERQMSEINVAI